MTTDRVMVGPMHHPTFSVPFVFAIEVNVIAYVQSANFRCNIDIVRN